jgi:nucleoside triphosphate diphosphatase
MEILRAPNGCPWDQEQTLDSLKPFVLEEAYEVLDAIERHAMSDLRAEIGDFVLEAVFLAQIAAEAGHFTIADSLTDITDKLVNRHPHVFGTSKRLAPKGGARGDVTNATQVKEQWEAIKARERAASGKRDKGPLDGIPRTLPALLRAYGIGNRAKAVGFDWSTPAEVLDKVDEELRELRTELDSSATDERVAEELGDLLFSMAHLARKLGIEPEAALRAANDKFSRRFAAMQELLRQRGLEFGDAKLDQMEEAWEEVKKIEGKAV